MKKVFGKFTKSRNSNGNSKSGDGDSANGSGWSMTHLQQHSTTQTAASDTSERPFTPKIYTPKPSHRELSPIENVRPISSVAVPVVNVIPPSPVQQQRQQQDVFRNVDVVELQNQLRASKLENERLKLELDKIKSVLNIKHDESSTRRHRHHEKQHRHREENSGEEESGEYEEQQNDQQKPRASKEQRPVPDEEQENRPAKKKMVIFGESSETSNAVKAVRIEKDYKTKQRLKHAILQNDFLKHLESAQVFEIVEYMYPMQVDAGCYIIKQGEEGNHLYVLGAGAATVEKDGKKVGSVQAGTAFGELAILYRCRRTASIISTESCQLWVLDRKVYKKIMIRSHTERQDEMMNMLQVVPALSQLPTEKLRKLADALEVDFFPAGEYIMRQGEAGDHFYILLKGTVDVTQKKSSRDLDGEERVINSLTKGGFFGEKALLYESRRTASVIATSDVECLTLHREAFNNLIGDIKDIVDKSYLDLPSKTSNAATLAQQSSVISVIAVSPPVSPTQRQEKADEDDLAQIFRLRIPVLSDFVVLQTLGVGAFGRVELVQHRRIPDRAFALKIMKKFHIVKMSQQEHVKSEKNILLRCDSPFICKLYCAMKDSKCLYLLSEFLPGGELWSKLRDVVRFDEVKVRFYSACALMALDYLHSNNIVYRDLKPENVLIDANGYGKLVDLGFAKQLDSSKKTWTFCGTPQYMAPEVILNKGHNQAVDFYELGIFMFELCTGVPPFEVKNNNQLECYKQVLRGVNAIEFPRFMSRDAVSIIKSLCQLSPVERLGNMKGGVKDIKKHKFFQGFDWSGLSARTLMAPIQPKMNGPTDARNFDEFDADVDSVPDDNSGWDANF